ncbi:MAG: NAD(P)H-dependent oxidoreductase, partial [Desulfopila sp.]|nr:NAD(P)H-dependent oxidoreductase [Desulfopila sp.]
MRSCTNRFAKQARKQEKKKMKIVVLNGSYRKNGTVASLLGCVVEPLAAEHEVEWIDVCRLTMQYCTTCMACREKE